MAVNLGAMASAMLFAGDDDDDDDMVAIFVAILDNKGVADSKDCRGEVCI